MHSKTSGIHSGTQAMRLKGALANSARMLNLTAASGVIGPHTDSFLIQSLIYGDEIDARQDG
jgi:hypothetical protein